MDDVVFELTSGSASASEFLMMAEVLSAHSPIVLSLLTWIMQNEYGRHLLLCECQRLMNILKMHQSNEAIQLAGIRLLACIAREQGELLLVEAGCIPRVIAAMKMHLTMADLQQHACGIIEDLASIMPTVLWRQVELKLFLLECEHIKVKLVSSVAVAVLLERWPAAANETAY
jgi:hypothetical protein